MPLNPYDRIVDEYERSRSGFRESEKEFVDDYEEAVRRVRELGLDPEEVPHEKPSGA